MYLVHFINEKREYNSTYVMYLPIICVQTDDMKHVPLCMYPALVTVS